MVVMHDYKLIDDAARKACRLYPGIVGDVLSREISSLTEFAFLGEGSRPDRLYRFIYEVPEDNPTGLQ